MALEELKKQIESKKGGVSGRNIEPEFSYHDIEAEEFWKEDNELKEPEFSKEKKEKLLRFLKKLLIGAVIGGVVLAVGVFLFRFLIQGGTHATRLIHLEVTGPDVISSGEAGTWEVIYRNDDNVALESVTLVFEFPPGTRPVYGDPDIDGVYRESRDIERVAAGTEAREKFKGVVFGEIGETVKGNVSIEYRPESSSARFGKQSEYEVRITHSQLGVSLDVPEKLQEGQETELTVHVVSSSDILFRNLSVEIEYPDAFEFVRATPVPFEENKIWRLGDVSPGEERTITIVGKIGKNIQEAQTFRAQLGIYNPPSGSWTVFSKARKTVAVGTPFLFIATNFDIPQQGIVRMGDKISVTVFWRNNLPVSVENAFVEIEIAGEALDLSSVDPLDGGTFDGTRNTIGWRAGRYPQFAVVEPGEEGRMQFNIQVKKSLLIQSRDDKNFAIQFFSTISTDRTPQGYEGVEIKGTAVTTLKITTNAGFAERGYYYTDRMQNSGPLPPRVGQETTYTIIWSVVSDVNDLAGVRVQATLPTYARWKNNIVPGDEQITFNPETGGIIWDAGTVYAGTGTVSPTREIAFQVGVFPSVAHVGKPIEIISIATMTGEDSFTGEHFERASGLVDTALKDDPLVKKSEQDVAQ